MYCWLRTVRSNSFEHAYHYRTSNTLFVKRADPISTLHKNGVYAINKRLNQKFLFIKHTDDLFTQLFKNRRPVISIGRNPSIPHLPLSYLILVMYQPLNLLFFTIFHLSQCLASLSDVVDFQRRLKQLRKIVLKCN